MTADASDSSRPAAAGPQFEFSGGALCLDFVNTIADRVQPSTEHLQSYLDLVGWAVQGGVLSAGEGRTLEYRARRAADRAAAVLSRAIRVREALYRVFSAVAAGQSPAAADISALNASLSRALPALGVVRQGQRFTWEWRCRDRLDAMLGPVLRSAAELLTSPEAASVRECASPSCSWMFVDRSRTGRRRWCSMRTCGNRNKARRHYRRARKLGA
jgi:predicted RNA-binding Zn ribbon-like protein